ncbi:NFX1-type zinc finger-containing protein [Nesidiocoris tenuis]|uniref:NFX1-type zinc finger-containing protein n=1 Tax=Nesidiocoris tenuis TaxID=355587 RepID=A0ABN7AS16_9HEMI|nr:NFX1-type zinc finger-containing protein [Nesidiocoris tenuis]
MDNPESNRRKVWRPSDATSQSTSQTIPKNPWRDQRQRGRSSSVQGRQNPRASGAGLSLFEVLHQNEQSPQGGELSVGGLPFAQDSKRLLSPSNADWKNPSKKIKGKKGLKGSSGKIEDWRNSDSNLSASSDAGCSHFTGAAPHLQTEFKQNNLKPNLRRHGNQRFQADHNITQLVTISDWRAVASLDSPLRILLKLQELESSWVRALHSNPSADVLSAAFEIFGIIDDKYTYDRLSLMKSLFKDTFFTSIINILKNLKTSWLSMGIENICSFVANLRENLKFLLLNDPAFHSDDTLQCALENLRAEIAAFLIHVNNKLMDLQGEEDARLNKELTEFEALYSIKSIEVKVVEESSYPDDFLAPYDVFPNIVQGAYQNYDHYIKTHFSLLKEDFQSVMREGVEQYLDDPKKRNFKIWAYQNVLVKPFWISEQKLLFKITFPECHYLARIQWKFCKRFMNNSLVVLTDDQFKTYHLAVVERREISGDNLAFIDVNFIKAVPQDFQKKKFLLVEPKTFFEPYLHSLAALKTMAKIGVPLKKYVVYADTTPKIPVYMGDDVVYKMDGLNIKINSLSSWPQPADLGLNEAQRTAFINALTNEVALIQGPPGTGKTYLAFKIISALLANRSVSYQKGPILVVCYKNHSLDQILSGLLTKQIKVRRIGSQTKNHILKYEANVKRLPPPPTINSLKKEQLSLESKLDSYFKEIQLKEKYIEAMDDRLGIISLDVFKMFKVVEDQVNLNIVRWLMELVEVDSPDTAEVHHQLETVALCWDGNRFYSESLVRLARELNRILRLIERLDGKLQYDELSQACENYWASFENYLRLFNALKIQTDSVPCPDVKSPDFLFDELDLEERWALYNEWVRQLKLRLEEDITAAKEDVVAVRESLNEFDEIVLSETLKADDPAVIGVTTTLAAKHYASLSKLGPKIVLVEEAAEVLEAHVVSSLSTKCEHLIMIGDHQQLRPNTASMDIGSSYRLNISFFERLINNDAKWSSLSTQHRMRPEIAELICPAIYPNLTNSPSVTLYPDVKGVAKNVFFFSHTHPEKDGFDSESKFNPNEADMVIAVCEYLLRQGYSAEDITILSTYLEHDRYIKKIIDKKRSPKWAGLMTTVVDNYQGEENTIVLLSLVRSNPFGSVGFLSIKNRVCVALSRAKHGLFMFGNMECLTKKEPTIWTEINQVLIRQESVGPQFSLKCLRHQNITKVETPADIYALEHSGCNMACAADLECGHSCRNACHGEDLEHTTKFTCKQPCLKKCEKGHFCPLTCDRPCPPCPTLLPKTLDCGHTRSLQCCKPPLQDHCEEMLEVKLEKCGHNQMVFCKLVPRIYSVACKATCEFEFTCGHLCKRTCHVQSNSVNQSVYSRSSFSARQPDHVCEQPCELINVNCPRKHRCAKKCREPCGSCKVPTEKTLPCNHKAVMPCNQDASKYICQQPCNRELPCHHTASMPCNQDISKVKCKNPCDRQLPCGHSCRNKCCEPCGPCREMVEKTIDECGHKKRVLCLVSLKRSDCISKCKKTKTCGHQCQGLCKTPCAEVDCQVKVQTELACGHGIRITCGKLEKTSKNDLLSMCKEPCKTQLPCTHRCKGSCGECFLGSLHRSCNSQCGILLVCGHRCSQSCSDLFHTCSASPNCFNTCWKDEQKKHVATTRTNKKGKKTKIVPFNPVKNFIDQIRRLSMKAFSSLTAQLKATENRDKLGKILDPLIKVTWRSLDSWKSPTDGLNFLKCHLFKLECAYNLVSSYKSISSNQQMSHPQKAELNCMVENIALVVAYGGNVSAYQMSQLQDLILWVNCNIFLCELNGRYPKQKDADPAEALAAAHKFLIGSRLAFTQDVRSEFYSLIKDKFATIDLEATTYIANLFPLSLKWCNPICHHKPVKPSQTQKNTRTNEEISVSEIDTKAGSVPKTTPANTAKVEITVAEPSDLMTSPPATKKRLVDYDSDETVLVTKMGLTAIHSYIEGGQIINEAEARSIEKHTETAKKPEMPDENRSVPVADLLGMTVSEADNHQSRSGQVASASICEMNSATDSLEEGELFDVDQSKVDIADDKSSAANVIQLEVETAKKNPWTSAETIDLDQDVAIQEADKESSAEVVDVDQLEVETAKKNPWTSADAIDMDQDVAILEADKESSAGVADVVLQDTKSKMTPWTSAETVEMDEDIAIQEGPSQDLPAILELPEEPNELPDEEHSSATADVVEPSPHDVEGQQKASQTWMDDID